MEIKDNFLDGRYFNELQKDILSCDFPWQYQDSVANRGEDNSNHFYFIHTLYGDFAPQSNFFPRVLPVLQELEVHSLIRIRLMLYVNQGSLVVHDKHIDFPYSHKAAVFYLNDNNGYTEFADGAKVESVANRVVIFDGSKEHNSTTCTDEKVRSVLSINYF